MPGHVAVAHHACYWPTYWVDSMDEGGLPLPALSSKLELDSTKLTIDLFFVDWLERQVQQRRTSEACTDFQRHYLGNKFSSILIILNI